MLFSHFLYPRIQSSYILVAQPLVLHKLLINSILNPYFFLQISNEAAKQNPQPHIDIKKKLQLEQTQQIQERNQ